MYGTWCKLILIICLSYCKGSTGWLSLQSEINKVNTNLQLKRCICSGHSGHKAVTTQWVQCVALYTTWRKRQDKGLCMQIIVTLTLWHLS